MRCAVSESLQLKFLAKMTGDISAMQKAGEPFSVKNYTRSLYDEILKKTGDQIKAQTFATYVPQNLLTILSVDKDFRTYLKPYMQEFTDLIDQFEDYDFVGVYLNVGQDALKEKEEDIVSTNIASLEYVPAPGEYELSQQEPEAVSGIEGFKQAYGKSILSTQGYERDRDGNVITDPVVLNSFAFVRKLDKARANGFLDNPELAEIKLKAVLAKSIMSELSGADRYYESSSSESGVKLIFVDSKGNPIRVDSEGNISDLEGSIIPQFNIAKPLLENGKFSRKIDESAEVLAKEFKTTPEEIEKSRQEDYRKVYALRNLLLANPNAEIYLDISGSTSGFVNIDYKNPIRLSEINFNALGIKFKPEVDSSGKGYFLVTQTSQKLQIDKPKISDVIDPAVLSKFIFDNNVDLETRKSVYEKLLYIKDLRLKPEGVFFKGQPITEESLTSLLNSTTISERGVVSPLYRANIHKKTLDTNSNIDIPFYENGQVDYKSMNIVDYIKTYFNTPAQLKDEFKATNPYVTFDISEELNLELAAFLEKNISFEPQVITEIEAKKADIERRRQEELKKFGTSENKTSKNNIKLLGINEYVSKELMELAYSNDKGNNPKIGGAGQTLNRIIERGGYSKEELRQLLKPEITKINAKYDAELASLEAPVQSIIESKPEVKKEGIIELFESNPELATIGTPEQYSKYLDTIFPDSKLKDILENRADNKRDIIGSFSDNRIPYFSSGYYEEYGKFVQKVILNITNPADLGGDIHHTFIVKNKKELEKRGYDSAITDGTMRPNGRYFTRNSKGKDSLRIENPTLSEQEIQKLFEEGRKADLEISPDNNIKENFEVVVFKPEQIHILGNKQDLEGFKNFVNNVVSTSISGAVEPVKEVKKEKVEIAELNFTINTTSIIDELSDNFIKAAAENNLSGIFNIPEDPSSMIDENIKNQTDKFCGNGNL